MDEPHLRAVPGRDRPFEPRLKLYPVTARPELDRHHLVPILPPVFHPPQRVTASAHHRLCRVHWSLVLSGASSSSSSSVATVASTTLFCSTSIPSTRIRPKPIATAPRSEVSNASFTARLIAGSDRSVRLTTVCMRTTRAQEGGTATNVTINSPAASPATLHTVTLLIPVLYRVVRVSIGHASGRRDVINYSILFRFLPGLIAGAGSFNTVCGKKYFIIF